MTVGTVRLVVFLIETRAEASLRPKQSCASMSTRPNVVPGHGRMWDVVGARKEPSRRDAS